MSVAFTKDNDAEAVAADLPDRPIPTHANLVTPRGLAQIEAALAAARADQAAALASETISSDRSAMARATRDLRYWAARRASAQLVETRPENGTAGFGSTVTLERDDGRQQRWTIVGDDEADPNAGLISWASPVARAVMGRQVGEVVSIAGGEAEILAIA